jgi:D-threo-aldose 1-dehydrogenase
MDPFEMRPIGSTALQAPRLGFGAGTLGDPFEVISEQQAELTLEAAFAADISYFDTAPWYGNGKSEQRVGRMLQNKPRSEFKLSTKVGRVYRRPDDVASFSQARWLGGLPFDLRFDYSRDGVLRSYEQSLLRMGVNKVDALVVHDLDLKHHKSEAGVATHLAQLEDGGGYRALLELKRNGDIAAVGVGINHAGMIPRFLERFAVDFFLLAMPYSLMEQEALDDELPQCTQQGVSVVIGAPFASGILATGPTAGARYGYQPPDPAVTAKVEAIRQVCERHGVPLGAAALQFPLGHPAVRMVIPGPNSPAQVRSNLKWMRTAIPADLWAELKQERLLRADAPVPADILSGGGSGTGTGAAG